MREQPQVGKVSRRVFAPEFRSIDEQARTIEFVSSTEAVDRYGDIIRVAGWKLDAYRKNPVFLWAHKSSEPPIGKTVDLRVETAPVPALVQKVEFADKETYPFADTVFNLYKGGFLRAVSVGFMPLEHPKRIEDAEGNPTGGYEFANQELLELSAVPVPANADALARAVSKGIVSQDELVMLRQDEPAEPPEDEPAGSPADTAEELAEQIDEAVAALVEAGKLCAVLVSQLEPGEPAGSEDAAPPAGRRRIGKKEAAYRELITLHQKIAGVAVALATNVVRETHAVLARQAAEKSNVFDEDFASGAELALKDLLAVVREAGTSVKDLPEPEPEGEADITTLEQLAAAVGSGGDEPVGDGETFSDSRRWRTGKFSITRELR